MSPSIQNGTTFALQILGPVIVPKARRRLMGNLMGDGNQHVDGYWVDCYSCREPYDALESVWCNCLTTDRTMVCPRCLCCFCTAPKEYKQSFWENAPQEIWNRLIEEQAKQNRVELDRSHWEIRRPLVLVVEPDRHIRVMAKLIIEDLGYGAIVAEDGCEGLALAQEYHPDLVLTAALMHKLDGREMARLIKENPATSHIKVAIVTSLYTKKKYRSEAFKRFHVDEYLSKPLQLNALQDLLHKYLDAAESAPG